MFRHSLLAASLMLTACGETTTQTTQTDVARSGQVVTSGTAEIGGDWALVDHTSTPRISDEFLGRPQMIYFGFAYCPDVCPAALSKMGAIADRIDPAGEAFHYLFFTVDPERDTPEALAQYVTADIFPNGLLGLTGEREEVEDAQTAFKIYAAKVEDDASASDYLYDHSDYIIVLGADGTFHDVISADEGVDAVSAQLKRDFQLR